jgi:hypothetical protein
VIRLGVCLGRLYREVEVSLADRQRFKYPMLLGRNFFGTDVIVDPANS